jgi:glycosyltransferase involved in cell wall biosynthesis
MPNILIEAMSSGLPIACSSYSPMPEFLEDAGLYFNPTKVGEIEPILEKMLVDHDLRKILSSYSYEYSKKFTWSKCADKTFLFLKRIAKK